MYFLIHPQGWINDERMAIHCLDPGCIGLYIPSDLEISLGLRPQDISRASGNLLVIGDVQPKSQYILFLGSVLVQNVASTLIQHSEMRTV